MCRGHISSIVVLRRGLKFGPEKEHCRRSDKSTSLTGPNAKQRGLVCSGTSGHAEGVAECLDIVRAPI
jgi:hypothetical protein